jgi:hypothetical protein
VVYVVQDVPAALNSLLDSLPAKISIQGLPFDAVFTYALYTLNYVIVKVGSQPGQPSLWCVGCSRGAAFMCSLQERERERERERHGLI